MGNYMVHDEDVSNIEGHLVLAQMCFSKTGAQTCGAVTSEILSTTSVLFSNRSNSFCPSMLITIFNVKLYFA